MTIKFILNNATVNNRISLEKLRELINISVKTRSYSFTDDEIRQSRNFLRNSKNYGYLQIISFDIQKSNISFFETDMRYNSGELSLEEGRNILLPLLIVNSIMIHQEFKFIEFEDILVILLENLENYFNTDSEAKLQNYISSVKTELMNLIYKEVNEFIVHNSLSSERVVTYNFDSIGLSDEVKFILSTLTPDEVNLIKLRFGFEDGRTPSLIDLEKELSVDRETLRKMEAKAIRKLRHPSRSESLRVYID